MPRPGVKKIFLRIKIGGSSCKNVQETISGCGKAGKSGNPGRFSAVSAGESKINLKFLKNK
jgi:hypothetical protein